MDLHSHCIRTGFIALLHGLMQSKWIKVARWFTTGCIRGLPLILKFWGQQVYHGTRYHLKVHWNQLPAKLQTTLSSMSLLKNTAKPERNRDGGNVELNDYTICFGTSDALQHGEGPSSMCTGTCAPVRVEDNAKLLTLRCRQISCSKLGLG